MPSDTDELFRDRAVRSWVVVQVVAVLVWLAAIGVLSLNGLSPWVFVPVMVLVAFGVAYLLDPRRSWWGTGPMAVMSDPAALRRYRRTMLLSVVGGLGVLFVVVALVVAWGIVTPSNV